MEKTSQERFAHSRAHRVSLELPPENQLHRGVEGSVILFGPVPGLPPKVSADSLHIHAGFDLLDERCIAGTFCR